MANVLHSLLVPFHWISAFSGLLIFLLLLTANWAHYWLDYYATYLHPDPLSEYDFVVGESFYLIDERHSAQMKHEALIWPFFKKRCTRAPIWELSNRIKAVDPLAVDFNTREIEITWF
jgi:hypothetical protein